MGILNNVVFHVQHASNVLSPNPKLLVFNETDIHTAFITYLGSVVPFPMSCPAGHEMLSYQLEALDLDQVEKVARTFMCMMYTL